MRAATTGLFAASQPLTWPAWAPNGHPLCSAHRLAPTLGSSLASEGAKVGLIILEAPSGRVSGGLFVARRAAWGRQRRAPKSCTHTARCCPLAVRVEASSVSDWPARKKGPLENANYCLPLALKAQSWLPVQFWIQISPTASPQAHCGATLQPLAPPSGCRLQNLSRVSHFSRDHQGPTRTARQQEQSRFLAPKRLAKKMALPFSASACSPFVLSLSRSTMILTMDLSPSPKLPPTQTNGASLHLLVAFHLP